MKAIHGRTLKRPSFLPFSQIRSITSTSIRHIRKEISSASSSTSNANSTPNQERAEDEASAKVDLTAALRSGRGLTTNVKNISRELQEDSDSPLGVKTKYQSEIKKTLSNDVQEAIKSLDSRSSNKSEQPPKRRIRTKLDSLLTKPRTQENKKLLSWGVSSLTSQKNPDILNLDSSSRGESESESEPSKKESLHAKRLPSFPRFLKQKADSANDSSLKRLTPSQTRRQRQHLQLARGENATFIHSRVLSSFSTTGSKLELLESPKGDRVPKLAHGLDRALFSPGVHFLQDPRTRIYNFSPNLKHIHDVAEYDSTLIPPFISASKDTQLLELAKTQKKKYISSTSSMTKVLTLFYLFLNNILRKAFPKKFNLEAPEMAKLVYNLSSTVMVEPRAFSKGKGDVSEKATYSISADKSMDTELYLSALGHCLELMLTTEYGKVNVLVKNAQNNTESDAVPPVDNVYSYSTCGDFLLRSQIDTYDERLPGNGTFDLKTRAVGAIRHDSKSYSHTSFGSNYQIWRETGEFESFEREMKDLIRTGALLKYGFQARIGGMDGVYIAYHNTHEFFGFQYIPLTEIDRIYYDRAMNYNVLKLKTESDYSLEHLLENLSNYVAKEQFTRSIDIWTDILEQCVGALPKGCPFRMTFANKKSGRNGCNKLRVFAVPVLKEEIRKLDLFPKAFETSFRFKHTPDVKFRELMKHRTELDAFNKKLVQEHEMVVFDIELFHPDGSEYNAKEQFKLYPSHLRDTWKTKYKITQLNNKEANVDEYLQLMSRESKFLVEGFITSMAVPANLRQALGEMLEKGEVGELTPADFEGDSDSQTLSTGYRKYSDIGEKRKKEWHHRDFEQPVLYKQQ